MNIEYAVSPGLLCRLGSSAHSLKCFGGSSLADQACCELGH